ncbi:c-type cytochrome biogenesis protein CcmI [Sneathiella marina]|uniref:C-type cytochrome biogenesis protein CcmI n=1 Tax=Sneathiella marina TaxID=2950108 RepID=A0ABY4W7B4_9PROT|nr:c-type cytochrome biogenesis protein CcmI [Sneathiella marina]USG61645.1 c-type cytochrome biogenesis protein CcmI [Sneathiella marina]
MIWFVVGVILAVSVGILIWPFTKKGLVSVSRTDGGLQVYEQQLNELRRDVDQGIMGTEEAESLAIEIKRRMLRVDQHKDPKNAGGSQTNRLIMIGLVLCVPLASLFIYFDLGSPDNPSQPLASRDIEAEKAAFAGDNIDQLIETLIDRLKSQPDNLDGWILLARSLSRSERYKEAAETFLQATALAPNDPDLYVGAGENFYFHAEGVVDADAENAFLKARDLDASHPGARYYLAVLQAQRGNVKEALDSWIDLFKQSPADAPFMTILERRIRDAAGKTGMEIGTLFDSKSDLMTTGPSEEDIAAAADMSADDRQAMITSMVDRLSTRMAEAPDYDGLMRLGQVYATLKEFDKSADAYGRASALVKDDVAAMAAEAFALIQASDSSANIPSRSIALYRKVLTLDSEQPQALWYVGVAEAQAGRDEEALRLWTKLQKLAAEDSQLYQAVTKSIGDLVDK